MISPLHLITTIAINNNSMQAQPKIAEGKEIRKQLGQLIVVQSFLITHIT